MSGSRRNDVSGQEPFSDSRLHSLTKGSQAKMLSASHVARPTEFLQECGSGVLSKNPASAVYCISFSLFIASWDAKVVSVLPLNTGTQNYRNKCLRLDQCWSSIICCMYVSAIFPRYSGAHSLRSATLVVQH